KAGAFPQPIEVGTRRIAWSEEEVDSHLEALVARRDKSAPDEGCDPCRLCARRAAEVVMGDDVVRKLRQDADEARKGILQDAGLTASDKNVGMAQIGHLNVDKESRNFGQMWPAIETLAGEVCLSDRTVQRSLRRLVDRGHFKVAMAGGGGGQGPGYGRATRYKLGSGRFNGDTARSLTVTPVSPYSLKNPEEHPKETRARDNGFWRFWDEYDHQVDQLAAAAAFASEIAEGATVEEILDGLRRYKEAKPEDHAWLNPANFLSRKRYRDRPAVQPNLLLPVKGGASSLQAGDETNAATEAWRQAIGMS
ncbi:MAG TPA: helix-turn-helix domain-containing protein, partial [Candidatus Dormibacteraeota bacterium]|nr:helix-turn-helix domain-containing protein [Candidatus Dormibacteraeota bacterium]